ncbi:MAG: hypothetical protein NW217_08595 [Hyphomicrobiaceae bacterium]|nr:hypothetical protein [Hyphomicrobiaceae bacterium]
MLICSCAVISDHDIERALIEIMSGENAPLPTPGVVWRHLSKKMNCCGCAPLAVETIYEKLEMLEQQGRICPCACANAKTRMRKSGLGGARWFTDDALVAAEPA